MRTINTKFCGTPVRWEITPVTHREVKDEDIAYLPGPKHNIKWYMAKMIPCLAGDDLFIGIGTKHGYVTFDGFCQAYKLTKDFVRDACLHTSRLVEVE